MPGSSQEITSEPNVENSPPEMSLSQALRSRRELEDGGMKPEIIN